jgi:hypothetical protein
MTKKDKKPKKLTKEELDSLSGIKKALDDLTLELGKIELTTLALADRKTKALEFRKALQDKEAQTAKYLEEKYGQGSIDTQNGTFIPSK